MLERTDAGHGFYAADPGSDRLFTNYFQNANIADAMHVRTAAKFLAVKAAGGMGIGNGYHANVVLGIFVAEKSEGAGGQGLFQGSDVGFDGGVEANFLVYLLLDVAQFLWVDGSEMREIKTQALWRIEGAGLLDVRAESIAQRRIDEVRSAVIAHDVRAALGVGDHGDAVTHAKRFLGGNAMSDQAGHGIKCTTNVSEALGAGVVVKAADVRHLAAGFGVDGGAVEHDFAAVAHFEFVDGAAFGNDRFNAAIFGGSRKIKARLGLEGFRNFGVGRTGSFLGCAFPGGTRAGALLFHGTFEYRPFDGDPGIAGEVFEEISRQAVGIVKHECFFAGE